MTFGADILVEECVERGVFGMAIVIRPAPGKVKATGGVFVRTARVRVISCLLWSGES
jgi:hypothetical protein